MRREAQRELTALPADAWELRVALPWLIRPSFGVPDEGLAAEEREFIMETREWYEEWRRKNVDEPLEALQAAREEEVAKAAKAARAANDALERAPLQMTVSLFELRLGRPPTEAERATLAERLRTLGQRRVGEVVLELTADAAAAWLADPNAR